MPPIGDLLAQISGQPSPTSTTQNDTFPTKRKPDDQIRKPLDKIQRIGLQPANSSRPMAQASRSSAVDTSMAKMKLSQHGQKTPAARPSTSTTSFKNGQPTPPPNDAPKAPPKKGSYAEIMARGKAAQANVGQIGKIQHKRIEKLPSKREREEMKTQKTLKLQKNLAPDSKFSKMGQNPLRNGPNGVRGSVKARAVPEPEKKVKKAATATTGYTGTSRPKPGGSGPSRPSASASRYDRGPDKYRGDRYKSSAQYAYASEEEDEEEADEEEEQDYDSDLSDMEAAAFEVDDEEAEAARIARREDAEALAEENRLKREKDAKRKKLADLVKSRKH